MRFLKLIATAITLNSSLLALAQDYAPAKHVHYKNNSRAKTTVADPAEDNYNVNYVKLDLEVSNTSTRVAGNVTTRAVVTAASMAAYVFELNPVLSIDSVVVNGVTCSLSSAGYIRSVALPAALTAGAAFTATVYYSGTPASGSSFGGPNGMNSFASPRWGNRATFTLSESYRANEWWPCKQSLKDKIDSADIWLTVPDSLKAGSNGTLEAVTTIDSAHVRYQWKERSPIDYYLISLSVANYIDYSYYMHFSGSTDSMLIQNYIYNNAGTLPAFRSVIDSTGIMVNFFSSLYGRYPFWKEKYGHAMAPLSGGMEHQTMTTLGFFDGPLVAHELGHQWFGDNVTCATWADIFINEAFASYSEYLFIDHFRNHTLATTDIRDRQDNVKTAPGGAIFVDDTTSENRIFDSRLSYDKGACVVHMLRFVINDDSVFFHILRAHQQQLKDSTATIQDFKHVAESIAGTTVNGMNLDTFFNQWAYGEGFPLYNVHWSQAGSDVYIQLNQSTSMPSSIPLFYTPLDIKLRSAAGDTTVRIFNNQASQTYHFTWAKAMTTLVMDPGYNLLYDLNSITRDLGVASINSTQVSIYPNPAAYYWQADNLPSGSRLMLTDITGKLLWEDNSGNAAVKIPAARLATGMYLLNISGQAGTANYKLVKQ
ncbi:MAG: T9SS type A sorting domain-containing protein [Taibaiella sp.]|nr:T9SS type A sorting domain-containing protein [Taibaiella sp.]